MNHVRTIAVAALLAAACACAPAPTDEGDTGDVVLAATVKSAITGGNRITVGAVWVHLWGTSSKGQTLDEWFRLDASASSPGQWRATVSKVLAGSYLVHGKAFQSAAASPWGVPDYESAGDVGVVVVAKETAAVTLTLQQNTVRWPPDVVNNSAPVVDALVAAKSRIDSGGAAPPPITLRASASDADGLADIAGYRWEASYDPPLAPGVSPGAFSAHAATQTDWTPPAGYEGAVTFSFTVTDRRLASSTAAITLAASPKFGPGNIAITVTVNNWPDVLSLTTTDGQLAPSDPAPTSLQVVAVDPDGDDLQYQWDDGACDGTFGSPRAATTTWRAGSIQGACPITVVITDHVKGSSPSVGRGGRTVATLVVTVRSPSVRYPPAFTLAARSGGADVPAAPGTVLQFVVEAIQPVAGSPVTYLPVTDYRWSDGLGGVFAPVGGDAGSVTWTAPACALLAPPYRVDVTVLAVGPQEAGGLATSLVFPVLVACP